eukprot:g1255.t1
MSCLDYDMDGYCAAEAIDLHDCGINASELALIRDCLEAAGLETITSLDLSGNNITTLDVSGSTTRGRFLQGLFSLFDGLTNLESLNLNNLGLTEIPDGVFDDLENLETLDLSENCFGTLDSDVFAPLGNLESLDLSDTCLVGLPGDIFAPLGNLTSLDLSDNPDISLIPTTEPCEIDDDCTIDGEICCPVQLVCEIPVDMTNPVACGDPHMIGFHGQKFDFTGQDGVWYALVSSLPSTHINMRVTTPVPSVPEITYITGVSLLTTDLDGVQHSVVISVKEPHSLESSCPAGVSPCLADGALSVLIDGEETLLKPGIVSVAPGVEVSAVNLPGACRSFGFEKYWEAKKIEFSQLGRRLGESQTMAEWILDDPTATNIAECAEYVADAMVEEGLGGGGSLGLGLFTHESEHASFKITTPSTTIRLSHGRLHQIAMRDPNTQQDLPDHLTWQMNLAVDHDGGKLGKGSTGILGETFVPTLDANGKRIMHGMGAIRGTQEDYIVGGPLEVDFILKGNN